MSFIQAKSCKGEGLIIEKDKIGQFKRDLRSLSYDESKSRDISDELIRLSRIMHEPKGIRYGERLGGMHLNYLKLMNKEELVNELKSYSFLIKTTRDRLNSLPDEERRLLEQLYIRRKSFIHIADKMGGVSERKLKYDVDDIIRKVI